MSTTKSNGWSGSYYNGARRDKKARKRAEAEVRQRDVLYERTAIYRRRAWHQEYVETVSRDALLASRLRRDGAA